MLEDAGLVRVPNGEIVIASSAESGAWQSPADGTYNRIEIAVQLILIDILTGTLTPMESDDLMLSLFAKKVVAANHGVAMSS